jgi:hypothetical protein
MRWVLGRIRRPVVKSPNGCCLDAMDVAERRSPYQDGSAAVEGTT